ncbi:ABC transporter substrate-binding protein [Salipaludibacillus sp. HK11]|uniref:ABC transporter substrate-binding protein n=1 Tax=Salipaludibacillus sp. HK11 TaxID=3394320 RepID=UPI0039FC60A9
MKAMLKGIILFMLVVLVACGDNEETAEDSLEMTNKESTSTENDEGIDEENNNEEKSLYPLTMTDASGKEHTFNEVPKIGCHWMGCAEILADIGVIPHASSATEDILTTAMAFPDGPPEHQIRDGEDAEEWAATEVDVIFKRGPASPDDDALEVAAPVFYLHGFNSSELRGLDEYYANYQIMGEIVGKQDEAEQAIKRFENIVENLSEKSEGDLTDTQITIQFGHATDNYYLLNSDQIFCEIISENGLGQCIDTGIEDTSGIVGGEINAEAVLELDPDWIVYMGDVEEREDVIWQRLSAVTDGNMYEADGNRYYCCSLRGMTHALQEYGHYIVNSEIPHPGDGWEFNPLNSPLINKE